ncbi:DUF2867 domain-containing protein [Sphingopyxis sp.]|uniref:DUF2867 domain-containing protein n=1 Tax=Sphingopyxis sp. TaxID=1908224 RepID=UPI003D6D9F75
MRMLTKPVAMPPDDAHQILARATFADRYDMKVAGSNLNAAEATMRIFTRVPRFVELLLALRNMIVGPLGLKAGLRGETSRLRIGDLPVISISDHRVVLGMDDKHLDFRVSVDVGTHDDGNQLVSVVSAVRVNNAFGRIYLKVVAPFHRRIVPWMMMQVCRPSETGVDEIC